ncbi:hypothetical protein [Pseudomonas aeruginosa]|uniref:hypothetical protein n=1 Tax=Pseudomonas aeruginosa TaxID=287 RepID=UPI00287BEB89|nr:hypothetical protein [Pseudomonas aeruginosa]MDS9954448.1 hypothetical protein [Pseudomonas aeruginosa]
MADTIAFCWASGLIQFGDQVPEGAIEIARGDDQVVREILVTNSRHAYDNVSLLVPGVPEATNQAEGVDALEWFIRLHRHVRQRRFPGRLCGGRVTWHATARNSCVTALAGVPQKRTSADAQQ